MQPEELSCGPVLCVDIGGTSTKLGTFERPDKLSYSESVPTTGPAGDFAEELARAIGRTIAATPAVAGIGIAVAGFLNEERDRMVYNSNLPWLENYPLREHIESATRLPVELEVDSNAAALAEYHLGVGRTSQRFLCAAIGTGFGVGMILNGEPLRFAYGCMGDPGHMIVQPNGPLCTCGGRGCAEILVSAPVLAEDFRARSGRQEQCTLRDVIHAARAGDEVAVSVLEHAGEWLGIATATLANTFFPDQIAFAGGLAEAGDFVLTAVRRSFEYSASHFARSRVVLSKASLGAMATLSGAAYPILTRLHRDLAMGSGDASGSLIG